MRGYLRSRSQDADGGSIIDAYQETQQHGHLGQQGLLLLAEIVRQELWRFPVLLAPGARWTDELVTEWVHDFFVAKGKAVTVALLAQTVDEASMGRYLRKAVRHFLVDAARNTDLGAIRRKAEDLLATSPAFERVPAGAVGAGRWHLAGQDVPPHGRDLAPLVAAAYAVPGVRAVRWTGRRRAPLASDESLVAILRSVLTAAAGSVEIGELTSVLARRFPTAVNIADATLEEHTFVQAVVPLEDRPDVAFEVTASAAEVYEQLSPSQRALLPHLDAPIGDRSEVLGLGRSQTSLMTAQLRRVLGELIPADEVREDVTMELYRLCVVNP
ncbi:MAG: hypothetical protein ACRDRH_13975 [Pseudonocardia sp.]